MAEDTGDASAVAEFFILLTDIAGSSRLAEAYPKQYLAALEAHNVIIESAVTRHGGEVFKHLGDGYLALFDQASGALAAAVDLQLALSAGLPDGPFLFSDGTQLGVRTVVHCGRLARLPGQEHDYFGPPLNRASRICKVCSPGQLLISGLVRQAVLALPPELVELDLGQVRLRDLGEPERLYQITHPCFAQRQFPPLQDLNSRPNNLAQQPNAFIGRDQELAELSLLLSGETRLLTLHAHGGYGKSRLASQLCAHLLWRFEHGAFEVLLAPVRDHKYLPKAIADATGFQFFGNREPKQQILDYLREKELLLCLDNFEHLLEGAEFVAEILRTAPRVRILVTSREPLRLAAERVYSVEPLPLGAGSDAVQLFVDRATRVKHRFRVDMESTPLVERICTRLEGVPLAIELVAAWVDQFTLSELLKEVEGQLELTARKRDKPERQRSVRASLDWSYGLLKPELQRALQCLSVFLGGFFVDAAEAVLEQKGAQLRNTLSALCDKSWLFVRDAGAAFSRSAGVGNLPPPAAAAVTRYFLRDVASHEYALELLKAPENAVEQARAALAHARYYSLHMAREGPRLAGDGTSTGQLESLHAIQLELLNIYAAAETLQSLLPATEASALLVPIAQWLSWHLYLKSDYSAMLERYERLRKAVLHRGGEQQILLLASVGCGQGRLRLSAFEASRNDLGLAMELAESLGDPAGVAAVLNDLGNIEHFQGHFDAARELHAKSLTMQRSVGNRHGWALSLTNLGCDELRQGNYDVARQLLAESLTIRREIGDGHGIAATLNALAVIYCAEGNYIAARELYTEALAMQRAIGSRFSVAASINNLGNVENAQGNYSAARALYAEGLAVQRDIGDRKGTAATLNNMGIVDEIQGNLGSAAELHSESLAIRREIGDHYGSAVSLNNLGIVEELRGNNSAARELHGQSLAIRREIGDHYGIAISLNNLGDLDFIEGCYHSARKLYAESLAIRCKVQDCAGICISLIGTGCLLATVGQCEAAATCLYGARYHATQLKIALERLVCDKLHEGLAIIEHPRTGLPSAERERSRAQAEAMAFDDLAQFALNELENLKEMPGTGLQQLMD